MPIPFSHISPETAVAKLDTIFNELSSLERLLSSVGANMNTLLVCQDMIVLLDSIRSELLGNHTDMILRIHSVIEQLSSIE
jgi:hypothetical protein